MNDPYRGYKPPVPEPGPLREPSFAEKYLWWWPFVPGTTDSTGPQ